VTLDAQSRALLAVLTAGTPPVESLTPAQARRASQERRARAQVPDVPVASVEDLTAAVATVDLPVRVYRPLLDVALPVVVFFHGGGWVLCDLDSHDVLCRTLARQTGCVVVSVAYRLAPEHRWPTAAEDAFAATCWVVEHAFELGVDPGRVAVMGDSAGGNLAAVVALMARDRGGPVLSFQSLMYPITDHDFTSKSYRNSHDGCYVTRSAMEWYWAHYLEHPDDGRHPYASPLRAADLTGLPPAYVLTAEHDPLRSEGAAYAARLAAAGVPTVHRDVAGVFHGFLSLAHLLDAGSSALQDSSAHIRAALAPSSKTLDV
jgi:acetyl esterase